LLVRGVQLLEQGTDRLGADLCLEAVITFFTRLDPQLVVLVLVQQLLILDFLVTRRRHHVAGVVRDLLQITQRHAHQVTELARQRLEEPDMRHRHSQIDVAHAFASHFRQRDFDAALVADMTAEADALELAAVTLPVLDRTEDPLAEQAVPFRLERPVIDRLRLGDFAERPAPDLLRRRDLQLDEVEIARARFTGTRKINHIPETLRLEEASNCNRPLSRRACDRRRCPA
jgi:hypothetical protein